MQDSKFDRRDVLKGVLLTAFGAPAVSHAAGLATLEESDPVAKALGYHADAKTVDAKAFPSYKATQACSNCAQLQPGTGGERGCNLFPGKAVKVGGWCKVWVQKA